MPSYLEITDNIQAHYSSSPSQVAKDARWATRLRVARPRNEGGDFSVEIGPELAAKVEAMINAAAPALADAFNRYMRPVGLGAYEGWPVRTGYMKSTVSLDYEVANGGTVYRSVMGVDSKEPKGAYMVRFYKPPRKPARDPKFVRPHSPLPVGARHGENVYRFLMYRPSQLASMRIADDTAAGIKRRA